MDDENILSIGEVVQLKSGGPKMTVRAVGAANDGTPWVSCQWFSDEGVKSAEFHPEALQPPGWS